MLSAFVNMSVMLSYVLMYESDILFDWTHSWRKWCLISICFMWSCKVGSSERFMAVLLSQHIVVGTVVVWLMLFKRVHSQMPSLDTLKAVVYSTLQEEVATVCCFFPCCDITPETSEYVWPHMLLLVLRQLAQFKLVKPTKDISFVPPSHGSRFHMPNK